MAKLAFFGTPEFSLPSLRAVHRFCHDFGHELSLVVCQSDRKQGRGQHLQPPPVKKLAVDLGLTVAQPETLRKGTDEGDSFYTYFSSLKIDLAVVVAYGKIIPERLIRKAERGFVNVHASLLPRFRGAAPVQRAIEAGDPQTGVCLMDIVKRLDEGDIYARRTTPIAASDTSSTLFRRLGNLGASLLYEDLGSLIAGTLPKVPQREEGVVYAHMLDKDEGLLDFSLSGKVLSRKVMAFDPWPGAYTFIRQKRVKFFDSFFIADNAVKPDANPGTVVVAGNFLGIKTIDGILYFQGMQVEGKRALAIKEALLGFPIAEGEKLGT